MKLAASNIAWDPSEDDAIAAVLRERGFDGVEIAPSKRWESPVDATKQEIDSYRGAWESRGLQIVAMQSLLYGRSDLQLFGSATARGALRDYLIALIEMAQGLGAKALVFGSPKNRQRGRLPMDEATGIAVEFFREVGAVAATRDCVVCIEPNPPIYDCDFVTTTAEAVALCEQIASSGVKVNGDAGAMIANGEDPARTIESSAAWFGHFHASEPRLAEINESHAQKAVGTSLRAARWSGWVSIEMRAVGDSHVDTMRLVADRVRRAYLGGP